MKIKLFFSIFFCGFLVSCSSKIDEEKAITDLLEKESATWRSGDSEGHASCWKIQPYSKVLVSTADGIALDIPPTAMIAPIKNSGGGSSKNTNYKIKIDNNIAYVSHDEESTNSKGKKTYSYEIRLLEKFGGDWKLVGQSIHAYKRK